MCRVAPVQWQYAVDLQVCKPWGRGASQGHGSGRAVGAGSGWIDGPWPDVRVPSQWGVWLA